MRKEVLRLNVLYLVVSSRRYDVVSTSPSSAEDDHSARKRRHAQQQQQHVVEQQFRTPVRSSRSEKNNKLLTLNVNLNINAGVGVPIVNNNNEVVGRSAGGSGSSSSTRGSKVYGTLAKLFGPRNTGGSRKGDASWEELPETHVNVSFNTTIPSSTD